MISMSTERLPGTEIAQVKSNLYDRRSKMKPINKTFMNCLLVGAVLLFLLSAHASEQTLLYTLDDPIPQADALFGNVLANIGDVNGDGAHDIAVVAAYQNVSGYTDQGQVFLFSGADGALLLILNDPNPQLQSPDHLFGHSLAGVGDMNGDGVLDIAVGARRQDVGTNFDQGQVFVFSGTDGSLLFTLNDPAPESYAWFGESMANIGDINSDGKPDLAVGTPIQDVNGYTSQGQVFVFSGLDRSLLLTLNDPNPQAEAYFSSRALSAAGDVNGDTVPDIAVGAWGQDVGVNVEQGQAFVFSGTDGSLLITLDDPDPNGNQGFGYRVAGVGDINGDLASDIAVAQYNAIHVHIFSGADGSLLFTLSDPLIQPNSFFGSSLGGISDINTDGVPDIAVGARLQGKVFIFSGFDGTLLLILDNPIPQASDPAQFGRSLAIGDMDGDGASDIAVGAHLYDVDDNADQGKVFVFSLSTPGTTPPGDNVGVTPVDPDPEVGDGTEVTVTFDIVTEGGETTVTSSDTGTPPPEGFKLGNPPVYYNIETTAGYDPPIQICIDYSGISYGNESNLRLFHQTDSGWEDVTDPGYPDTVNKIICGTVDSLSAFAMLEPAYQFVGFLSPLENPPVVNTAKAGRTIPVKFQLIDEYGYYISDLGAVTGIWYQATLCEGTLENEVYETDTSGSSGLRYDMDANQFIHTWKTEKGMTGCYRLIMEIYGFDQYVVDFELK
jgi:hypothetical protein